MSASASAVLGNDLSAFGAREPETEGGGRKAVEEPGKEPGEGGGGRGARRLALSIRAFDCPRATSRGRLRREVSLDNSCLTDVDAFAVLVPAVQDEVVDPAVLDVVVENLLRGCGIGATRSLAVGVDIYAGPATLVRSLLQRTRRLLIFVLFPMRRNTSTGR